MERRSFLNMTSAMAAGLVMAPQGASARKPASPDTETRTKEEIVAVKTADDIDQSGLLVCPATEPAKPTAVVWVHGATANFYYPTYVAIARAMASLGYRFFLGNTRMHDLGCVLSDKAGVVMRGGSLWGLPSGEVTDIAAWIDAAETRGHKSLVLIGHSAGGPAVRRYMAAHPDHRVIGWGQASVGLGLWPPKPDAEHVRIASDLVSAGRGQDFMPNLRLSAATFLDYAQTPEDIFDFYGIETPSPAVSRVRKPLLAFYGTEQDVGSNGDLDHLRALIRAHAPAMRVDTTLIQGADHDYTGKAEDVSRVIDAWIRTLDGH